MFESLTAPRPGLVLTLLVAAVSARPANATQSVECHLDDKNGKAVVQAAVGSAGGGMTNFGGEIELKLKGSRTTCARSRSSAII